MVDPDTHPTLVGGQVIDAIGHNLAQIGINEVVDANFFRISLGLPFSSAVFEIANQPFFLVSTETTGSPTH